MGVNHFSLMTQTERKRYKIHRKIMLFILLIYSFGKDAQKKKGNQPVKQRANFDFDL